MLTTYLTTPLTLARYRIGPAGPHLDRFTEWLEARGYQPDRVLHLLRGVHRFSCWAHRAGLPVQGLGAEAIEAFRHHLHTAQRLHYPSGNYSHLFMGARHFVAFLAATGQLTAPALIPTGSSEPPLLVEFRHWMSTHRGTTAATVHNYRLPRPISLQRAASHQHSIPLKPYGPLSSSRPSAMAVAARRPWGLRSACFSAF